MLSLIRRISGVFPRTTRSWRDNDSNSTPAAPQIGRKRRRSSSDVELDDVVSAKKTKTQEGVPGEADEASQPSARDDSPNRAPETEEVKEVTKGVKEVDLEDNGRQIKLAQPEETAATVTQSETQLVGVPAGETVDNASETTSDSNQEREEQPDHVDSRPSTPVEQPSTTETSAPTGDEVEAKPAEDRAALNNDSPTTPIEMVPSDRIESTTVESSTNV